MPVGRSAAGLPNCQKTGSTELMARSTTPAPESVGPDVRLGEAVGLNSTAADQLAVFHPNRTDRIEHRHLNE